MGDILFLAHRFPWPPDRGDRIRSRHLLGAIARLGTVHVAAFVDDEDDLRLVDRLPEDIGRCHVEIRQRSRRVAGAIALATGRPVSLAAFDSPAMRHMIGRFLDEEPIDTIVAFSGQMAQFVPVDRGDIRFVMDFVDVDSAKFEAYADAATGPMAAIQRREAALLARFEAETAKRADLSLFVSDAEADLFRKRSGIAAHKVATLENGIDLGELRPGIVEPVTGQGSPLIVFTGQMDYRPNIDAVAGFARSQLPAIRAVHPNATFAIVGRAPDPAVVALGELPGVVVTGAVPDVRPWLAAADVVVAPLEIARGVQNKVLEAMAMGRPVVASPAAFEGIVAEPGRDLIVAEAPAPAILDLLADAQRAGTLGRSARAAVEARYGWRARLCPLAAMIGREPIALAAE